MRPLFLGLAARLDREPIPWPGANPAELNGNVLRQSMLDSFYDPDDYPALARLIRAAQQGTVPPAPTGPPEAVLQNVTAVAAATICNDADWPSDPAVYREGVAESRAKYPLTGACRGTRCRAPPGRGSRRRRRCTSPTAVPPTS